MLIIGLFVLCAFGCQNEEGTVKYDDCREIIYLQPNTWQTYYKSFICEYLRRATGKIVGGKCVHVETDSGLFYSSGKCKAAYVYIFTKGPDEGCTKEFPFKGYDNKCYKDWYAADMSSKNTSSK